jgi:hypothetical protein
VIAAIDPLAFRQPVAEHFCQVWESARLAGSEQEANPPKRSHIPRSAGEAGEYRPQHHDLGKDPAYA